MFDKIHKGLFGVSRVAVWCGGAALLLSAIMVTLDVIARKLFSITISGSDEISGYVFAAATTWAYSFCLFSKSNIRIDALYTHLSVRSRAWLGRWVQTRLLSCSADTGRGTTARSGTKRSLWPIAGGRCSALAGNTLSLCCGR